MFRNVRMQGLQKWEALCGGRLDPAKTTNPSPLNEVYSECLEGTRKENPH